MKTMSWILSNSRRLNTISGRTNRSNPQLPVDRYYCFNQPQPVVSEIYKLTKYYFLLLSTLYSLTLTKLKFGFNVFLCQDNGNLSHFT